jgi:glycosyltransferase involved in cell wall biosynthesis
MRLVIHDFGSYHFPKQLACALARRGHDVLHLYSGSEPLRCGGGVPEDVRENFTSYPVELAEEFKRNSFIKRRSWSIQYGKVVAKEIRSFHPDVVVSADTPLDSQCSILAACRKMRSGFVYWLQDLLGLGTRRILRKKIPVLGSLVGMYYEQMERRLLRQSDRVIAITEDFLKETDAAGVSRDKVDVIENWAPLDELPALPRNNTWSRKHGAGDKLCVLYAGLLGMKQNPDLLVALAKALDSRQDVELIITAEGGAVERVKQQVAAAGLQNVRFLPFQPYAEFPAMLASADVLLAVLDADGSQFCVPSKVLSYMCSGRPLLLSVPQGNLAARLVERVGAGIVVGPDDTAEFCRTAQKLLDNEPLRQQMGAAGRGYAEDTFNIDLIADRFEKIFFELAAEGPQRTNDRMIHEYGSKRPLASAK